MYPLGEFQLVPDVMQRSMGKSWDCASAKGTTRLGSMPADNARSAALAGPIQSIRVDSRRRKKTWEMKENTNAPS